MYTVTLKTEVKATATLNGKPVDDILREVCDAAHEAFFNTSRFRALHEDDGTDLNEIDMVDGELCRILYLLGD